MAQSFQSSSNCPEHNAFYNNSDLERVKALVSRITHDGAIYLNPDKSDSLEFVFQRMGIQSSSTFSRTFETRSRLDTTKYFERFQQYYNSVKVEGGG